METKSLTSEINANITEIKKLIESDPSSEELQTALQDLYDALDKAQGTEYVEAKAAFDKAKKAAQEAIDDLSKTAETITLVSNAIEKLLKAIALFA